jgi:hypothetical protein
MSTKCQPRFFQLLSNLYILQNNDVIFSPIISRIEIGSCQVLFPFSVTVQQVHQPDRIR